MYPAQSQATSDLGSIAREREAAGEAPDHFEWAMDFAHADDASFYFYTEAGQSSVTVTATATIAL